MLPLAEESGLQAQQRALVVREALSWVGTPYQSNQGCKGAGVDCAWLLLRVYTACSVVSVQEPMPYKGALARMRAGEQFYQAMIARFAVPVVREARPGDIVLFRVPMSTRQGNVVARVTHGAIVEQWPVVVHAYQPAGAVVRSDLDAEQPLARIVDSLWSLRCWEEPS